MCKRNVKISVIVPVYNVERYLPACMDSLVNQTMEDIEIIAVNDGAKRAVYNHLVACGNEKYRLSKIAEWVPVYRDRLDYLSSVTGDVKNIKNALPYLWR